MGRGRGTEGAERHHKPIDLFKSLTHKLRKRERVLEQRRTFVRDRDCVGSLCHPFTLRSRSCGCIVGKVYFFFVHSLPSLHCFAIPFPSLPSPSTLTPYSHSDSHPRNLASSITHSLPPLPSLPPPSPSQFRFRSWLSSFSSHHLLSPTQPNPTLIRSFSDIIKKSPSVCLRMSCMHLQLHIHLSLHFSRQNSRPHLNPPFYSSLASVPCST